MRKYCKKSDYSRGLLELDGRVPVGAELESINGHNVKSSKYEKILSFFNRRDVARFKLSIRISSVDLQRPQKKMSESDNMRSRPAVDHQIRSEKLDVATHRRSVKQKFKMAIRRWRLTKERGSTFVEYEVVCALKTGDSIKRWTVWKRYVVSNVRIVSLRCTHSNIQQVQSVSKTSQRDSKKFRLAIRAIKS